MRAGGAIAARPTRDRSARSCVAGARRGDRRHRRRSARPRPARRRCSTPWCRRSPPAGPRSPPGRRGRRSPRAMADAAEAGAVGHDPDAGHEGPRLVPRRTVDRPPGPGRDLVRAAAARAGRRRPASLTGRPDRGRGRHASGRRRAAPGHPGVGVGRLLPVDGGAEDVPGGRLRPLRAADDGAGHVRPSWPAARGPRQRPPTELEALGARRPRHGPARRSARSSRPRRCSRGIPGSWSRRSPAVAAGARRGRGDPRRHGEQADALAAVDDDYFRERAADVRDVGRRVAALVRGEPRPDLWHADGHPAVLVAADLDPSAVATLRPRARRRDRARRRRADRARGDRRAGARDPARARARAGDRRASRRPPRSPSTARPARSSSTRCGGRLAALGRRRVAMSAAPAPRSGVAPATGSRSSANVASPLEAEARLRPARRASGWSAPSCCSWAATRRRRSTSSEPTYARIRAAMRRSAGRVPDARHRRRQAGRLADRSSRGEPGARGPWRPARSAPARPARRPAPCPGRGGGRRRAAGHAADGVDASRSSTPSRAASTPSSRRRRVGWPGRRASSLGVMIEVPSAAVMADALAEVGRLLLDRDQRPGPVHARRGPDEPGAGRSGHRAPAGGAAAHRRRRPGGAAARPACRGVRRGGRRPDGHPAPRRAGRRGAECHAGVRRLGPRRAGWPRLGRVRTTRRERAPGTLTCRGPCAAQRTGRMSARSPRAAAPDRGAGGPGARIGWDRSATIDSPQRSQGARSAANRTGGPNIACRLYSAVRGDHRPAADPLAPFSPAVRAGSSRASRRPPRRRPGAGRPSPGGATRSSTRRPAAARPSPRSCGASTGSPRDPCPPPTRDQPGQRPRPVRLAAQGADLRRRAQPARAAARHRRSRPSASASRAEDHDRRANRRHAPGGAPRARPAPAGHPGHDPREPVPAAHERRPRDPPRRRARDRRRGPRDRRHEARRPPGPLPRAPGAPPRRRTTRRRSQRIGLSATQRPLETIARFLGGIGPGREVDDRRRRAPQAARARGRRPGRGHGPRSARSSRPTSSPAARSRSGDMRTSIWPAIHPRHPRADPGPPQHDRLHQQPPARRAARPAAQRARRRGARPRPPRLHRPRAAARDRGGAQGRPAPRARRDVSSLELGIDMGAVDLVIQVESPTSVARGLQRVGRAGHQVGEPCKGVIFPKYRGDLLERAVVVAADARRRDRDDGHAAQPARRARPAARRDDGDGPLDRSTSCSSS